VRRPLPGGNYEASAAAAARRSGVPARGAALAPPSRPPPRAGGRLRPLQKAPRILAPRGARLGRPARRRQRHRASLLPPPPPARRINAIRAARRHVCAPQMQVGVHIADVTHFIKPGTPIDDEAAARATTTYLVGFLES
jgi:hypothetical protein